MKNNYQLLNIRQQITTCLLMLPLTFSLLAQTTSSMEVQGQINDGTSPILGATVLIKGEQRGTVSDLLVFHSNVNLRICFINNATFEESVTNQGCLEFIINTIYVEGW